MALFPLQEDPLNQSTFGFNTAGSFHSPALMRSPLRVLFDRFAVQSQELSSYKGQFAMLRQRQRPRSKKREATPAKPSKQTRSFGFDFAVKAGAKHLGLRSEAKKHKPL